MEIIRNRKDLNTLLRAKRSERLKIGLIPTMGSIHQGHISLVENSKKRGLFSVVTIYINPTQFNNRTDYLNYPKSLDKDFEKLIAIDCDAVYLPQQKEIYPKIVQSKKTIKNYRNILCDKFRPGHFDGVTTVVEALFRIVNPDEAFFGEKDYQQLKIIEKFIEEKYKSLDLVSVPTQRHEEGIAYSSRNEKLSKKQTQDFVDFHKKVKNFIGSLEGSLDIETANEKANDFMKSQDIDKLDYFEFRNDTDLSFVGTLSQARLFYAIYKGKVRLIDNLKV